MIYKKENIVDAILNGDIDIAVQGSNCFCGMGNGLAREVKNRIPQAFYADAQTVKGDKNKLGTYSQANLINGKIFLNLYTQYHYIKNLNNEKQVSNGRYKYLLCNYEAIRNCCINIKNNFSSDKTIAFPKIGCGLANGDWNVVKKIIKEELSEFQIFIYYL